MENKNQNVAIATELVPVHESGQFAQKDAREYLLFIYKQLKKVIDQPTQVNIHSELSETSVLFIAGNSQISINITEG